MSLSAHDRESYKEITQAGDLDWRTVKKYLM
ncbi:hypothetical protein HNP84_007235 [Thermocatellispora tengchongensis]|uniref:Uncharacterized protein n=1 Tax=Thermocatellispora tengchongensis TaxID=1073253 RepID=A0A840PHV6_9ACTN|nr:hypothetical protein [Thermocatellispora tengchongensis]